MVEKPLEHDVLKFPFSEICGDVITFKRYQLVHHSPSVAILVSDPSAFRVTVKSRSDVSTALQPLSPLPSKSDQGSVQKVEVRTEKYHEVKESATNVVDSDLRNECFTTMKETDDAPQTVAEGQTIQSSVSPKVILPQEEAVVFFQWQWEKLTKDDSGGEESDTSLCMSTADHTIDGPELSDKGSDALIVYQRARAVCMELWSNRFAMLVGRHIMSASRSLPFLQLSVDDICDLLSSDYLAARHERNIFRAAYRWLRFDAQQRLEHANRVLGQVRYEMMPSSDLFKCLFRSRRLLRLLLDVPLFPRAVLTGMIRKHFADLDIRAEPEFSMRRRTSLWDLTEQSICPLEG